MRALLCNPARRYLFRSSDDQSTLFCSPCFFFFFFFLLARRRHTIPSPSLGVQSLLARSRCLPWRRPLPAGRCAASCWRASPAACWSLAAHQVRCHHFAHALSALLCCFSFLDTAHLFVSHADGSVAAAAAFHGQKRDAPEIVGRALVCFDDRYVSARITSLSNNSIRSNA